MKDLLVSGGICPSPQEEDLVLSPTGHRPRHRHLSSPGESPVGQAPPQVDEPGKGGDCLPQMTLTQVAVHCSFDDCWLVIDDRVYDITDFLRQHPGGEEVLLEHAGRDATWTFRGVSHSSQALALMDSFCVGVLVQEERLNLWSRQPRRLPLSP